MSCDRGGDVLKVGQMLGDDRLGWSAVVANSLLRAILFKIPHHGSSTTHHQDNRRN
jgi:hypothetical protein